MKKFATLLMLTAIMVLAVVTPLLAMEKIISETEFTAKTGLTVEDVISEDDEIISTIDITIVENDDCYIVHIDGKTYIIYK
jgi:hypothetical protein